MQRLLKIARGIDRLSTRTGQIVYWLTLLMVLLGSFNAIVRYLDKYTGLGLSSNTYIELQWYLFGLVFLLGAAYTLRENAHVRVDVFYGRLSRKGRAWINIAGTIAFLLPFCITMIVVSWPAVRNSWVIFEGSPDPGGLPRYPIKTVIPIAFLLLALQGISLLIKSVSVVVGGDETGDPDEATSVGGHV
ncbi:MAG: TRAP transporter small permease subunit [Rhodothermales bacterium]|nr:TRAP transporter small permease subunit [Rhodothermales bacterium]